MPEHRVRTDGFTVFVTTEPETQVVGVKTVHADGTECYAHRGDLDYLREFVHRLVPLVFVPMCPPDAMQDFQVEMRQLLSVVETEFGEGEGNA